MVYARSFVNAVNHMPTQDVTDMPLDPTLLSEQGSFVLNVGAFSHVFPGSYMNNMNTCMNGNRLIDFDSLRF